MIELGKHGFSRAFQDAFAKEYADLKSIEGKMVDKEFTKVLRLAMNDLKAGVDSHNGLGLIARTFKGYS